MFSALSVGATEENRINGQSIELVGKRLELLREFVPGAAPVAMLWHRKHLANWQAARAAARIRGWKLLSIEIDNAGEIDAAFKTAVDARASALFVHAPAVLQEHWQRVMELALKHRLPTMLHQRGYVTAGGLMASGADVNEIWHQAAGYVDKILKGARPGDLPVQQPTKFELVINYPRMAAAVRLGGSSEARTRQSRPHLPDFCPTRRKKHLAFLLSAWFTYRFW